MLQLLFWCNEIWWKLLQREHYVICLSNLHRYWRISAASCEIKAVWIHTEGCNMSSNLARGFHTLCSRGFVESVIVLVLWCFHFPPAEFFPIQSFQLAPSQRHREAMTTKGLKRTPHNTHKLKMAGCCRLTTFGEPVFYWGVAGLFLKVM